MDFVPFGVLQAVKSQRTWMIAANQEAARGRLCIEGNSTTEFMAGAIPPPHPDPVATLARHEMGAPGWETASRKVVPQGEGTARDAG